MSSMLMTSMYMMKNKIKFKKIYLEIINYCNLDCPFCVQSNKEPQMMDLEDLNNILPMVKKYTDYLYLHLKGEPLMHPDFDKIIELTNEYGLTVNITTNGFLLEKYFDTIMKSNNIRQINISFQSLITQSIEKRKQYLDTVIPMVEKLEKRIFISLRLWNDERKQDVVALNKMIIDYLNDYFKIDILENYHGQKINQRIYLSKEEEFEWPAILDAEDNSGYCLGGKTHIGILSDGTVTICCLDHNGLSDLGNVFNNSLDDILGSEKFLAIREAFQNRKLVLPLCKSCTYRYRFNK